MFRLLQESFMVTFTLESFIEFIELNSIGLKYVKSIKNILCPKELITTNWENQVVR